MTTQKKQEVKKETINPVAVAVAGAVVGASIAVAGVALSDKKNREKIQEVAIKATNLTKEYVENIQKQAKVKKVMDSAKNSIHQTANAVNKAVQAI